jgi:hypothetical protein
MASVTFRLRAEDTWLATASRARLRWVSVALAFVFFAVTQGMHWAFFPLTDLELLGRRMAGDGLGAVLVGLLVYRVLIGLHERRRATLDRLRLIGELNHHIRNSLQTIQFSAQTLDHEESIQQINESVARISRVLREIVPMHTEDVPPPK